MERKETHLNAEEHDLIKELLRPGVSIDAVLPEDADSEKLWSTLSACVRGLNLLEIRLCRLKPIIGRILLMFEHQPSLYKALGYETYSDFMKRGVHDSLGLHHTSAYEAQRVAKDWPQLTPDRFAKIGQKKMNVLHKFATGRDPNAEALLATAEKMTVGEFRQYAEQRGLTEPGETVGATIIIHTNQDVYSLYRQLFSDGRIPYSQRTRSA
jgi:hypothetical protein